MVVNPARRRTANKYGRQHLPRLPAVPAKGISAVSFCGFGFGSLTTDGGEQVAGIPGILLFF